ncbi:nucleotide-diphospho-sugar transferase [Favolaschia claudopus]|uniref:Nucleotide-diphospho-sugar transferase n=1 Tax=Favolaschia claudopus TaxID=2862362 RepID=A0AAW0DC37_9AGAR
MFIPARRYAVATIATFVSLWYLSSLSWNLQPSPRGSSFRFGSQISSKPAGPPYKASLVYLTTTMPQSRPKDWIFRSLLLVQKNIPWRYQWPILLFHAGVYDSEENQFKFLDNIRNAAEENAVTTEDVDKLIKRIEFVHYEHFLPDIDFETMDPKPVWWEGYWPAYHHMCAFFSYKIFNHPRISSLDYYFRLDDDSFIREPTCFDPFEYMHVNNKSLAYRSEDPDYGFVTIGMWQFVSKYANTHPDVENRMLRNQWPWLPNRDSADYGSDEFIPAYGGNFEVVKVPRFQTPEVRAFLESLASDPERFYRHRWGDAPLRKVTAYMFLDVAREVHLMCEFAYAHKVDENFANCECKPLPRLAQ